MLSVLFTFWINILITICKIFVILLIIGVCMIGITLINQERKNKYWTSIGKKPIFNFSIMGT